MVVAKNEWESMGGTREELTQECGLVWLWITVWGSSLSEYIQYGGCRLKETIGFDWGRK